MKLKGMLTLACCAVMWMAADVASAVNCTLSSCTTNVTVDSGNAGKRCTVVNPGPGSACDCTTTQLGCSQTKYVTNTGLGACGGWLNFGTDVSGTKRCCGLYCARTPEQVAEQQAAELELVSQNVEGLEDVFGADIDGTRATEHYGYVNGANRSPNNGRSVSAAARLDACLFYTDVDAIYAYASNERLARCKGTIGGSFCADTNKNEYCNATGMNDGASTPAAVCKDRCDCVFGGNCENL
jgi:hypothetical protein